MPEMTYTVKLNTLAPQIRKLIKDCGVAPKEIQITLEQGEVASEITNYRVQGKVISGAAGTRDASYIGSDGEHNSNEILYGKAVLGYGKKMGRGYPSFARINIAVPHVGEVASDTELAVALDMLLAML